MMLGLDPSPPVCHVSCEFECISLGLQTNEARSDSLHTHAYQPMIASSCGRMIIVSFELRPAAIPQPIPHVEGHYARALLGSQPSVRRPGAAAREAHAATCTPLEKSMQCSENTAQLARPSFVVDIPERSQPLKIL